MRLTVGKSVLDIPGRNIQISAGRNPEMFARQCIAVANPKNIQYCGWYQIWCFSIEGGRNLADNAGYEANKTRKEGPWLRIVSQNICRGK